ncbi:MAG: YceI family protein [Pseudomonadota bacterium]|nr:YceI family protein [Pseudomonadota bacterium]
MNKTANLLATLSFSGLLLATPVLAEEYVIDTKKAHAAILFQISHLGIGLVNGQFKDFSGSFSYDEKNPADARVEVTINTESVDTNHAERDKHLRGKDFLETGKYPEAKFVSTSFEENGDEAVLKGDLTLHGITKPVVIDVKHLGHGEDPWGGYRRGFEGATRIALADFGIDFNLGPAAKEMELFFAVEGIRQ